jgi:uncharacterized membrane protein
MSRVERVVSTIEGAALGIVVGVAVAVGFVAVVAGVLIREFRDLATTKRTGS